MQVRQINAEKAPEAAGYYSQAVEVSGSSRTLYVSGQVPTEKDGTVPADFASQVRLTFANIEHQLEAAGMSFDNVVKYTAYLSSHEHRLEFRNVRQEVLGDRRPALTVVIAGIFDPEWLLEVDAIAVA
ncbi:MAG: RidA family protein [Pseudomonadota bacterium]